MSISMIGLDTAKTVFQIHGVNEAGKAEIRRTLRRNELIPFFEKQEACMVVMEACGAVAFPRLQASRSHILPETP